jgi:protein-disulfide isomerase
VRSPERRIPAVVLGTIAAVVLGLAAVGIVAFSSRPPVIASAAQTTTPPALAHGRDLGSPTAPVTLDVWSDFQCPYCLAFWTSSEPEIVTSFVATGQVRLVYHDFAFIGQESLDAAVAARCADEQGKFWPYHDLLYANQGTENTGHFSADLLTNLASQAGLDVGAWQSCLDDPSIAAAVTQETAQGRASGVSGTPTLFVNGTKLADFYFPTVSSAIEAALSGPSPTVASPASPSP